MSRTRPPRDLSDRRLYRWIGTLGGWLIRAWGATLDVEWIGKDNLEAVGGKEGHVLWTFWHCRLLTLAYTHRWCGIVVLVSRHRDGEIISQIICHLGYGVVRGSSTRGGLRALMEMARTGRAGRSLAVTPDGPRGPRWGLQSGVLHIAQRSGLPIVPLAVESVRRTELSTWDRFLVPHPWSRVVIVVGRPVRIPVEADASRLEADWGPRVLACMLECEERAAAWRRARIGGSGR